MAKIDQADAERAYSFLFARYTELYPYRGGSSNEGAELWRAERQGYYQAVLDAAVAAYGPHEGTMRVAEDYQDYVASLG